MSNKQDNRGVYVPLGRYDELLRAETIFNALKKILTSKGGYITEEYLTAILGDQDNTPGQNNV